MKPEMAQRRLDILEWLAKRPRPVLFSEAENELGLCFVDEAFRGLIRDGVIAAVFPDSRPGDSGLQYWDFSNRAARNG
jgi:hypothetical protein